MKNPSCEKVGVINTFDYNKKHFVEHSGYKIIIPKEKGINSWSGEKGVKGVNGIECCDGTEEPKQSAVEWLEEVYNKCPAYEESILEQEWKQAKEMERQKDAKYNETIEELLKELSFHGYTHSKAINNAKQLIKEATEI